MRTLLVSALAALAALAVATPTLAAPGDPTTAVGVETVNDIQCGDLTWSAFVTVVIAGDEPVTITYSDDYNAPATVTYGAGTWIIPFGPYPVSDLFVQYHVDGTWATGSFNVNRPGRTWGAFEPQHSPCPIPPPATPVQSATCGMADRVTILDVQRVRFDPPPGVYTLTSPLTVTAEPTNGFYFDGPEPFWLQWTFTSAAIVPCPFVTLPGTSAPGTSVVPTTTGTVPVTARSPETTTSLQQQGPSSLGSTTTAIATTNLRLPATGNRNMLPLASWLLAAGGVALVIRRR